MYLDFYGLTEKPFTITPNPHFIFFSTFHKEAFALLLYGINNHSGFMELTGEVGTGKTTVLRTLLGQLNEETHRIALIFNPSLSAVDLLRAINREFGISGSPDNAAELLAELNRFLLRENACGRTVVLVIDEAQNLAPDVLEQIRLISNLETETDKLIQIVLAGQPELERLLSRPELRQINQRIALRYHLRPLDRKDSAAYIEHRLNIAGGRGKVSFTPAAIRWIYRYSRGTPRLINMLCDRALLIGYTEDRKLITARIAANAFKDIMLKRAPTSRLFAGGTAIVCIFLVIAFFGYQSLAGRKTGATEKRSVPASGPISTNQQSLPAFAQMSGAELKQALRADIAVRSESKSAVQSFNALAEIWRVPTIEGLDETLPLMKEIKQQAIKRSLEMTRFNGTLKELLRLDLPALLVVSAPEEEGTILVALTGIRDGNLLVSPPLFGRGQFTPKEFSRFWSGSAYLLWRNADHIPLPLGQGAAGAKVKRVQNLLRDAGNHDLKASGVYDEQTATSVRSFQSSRGVEETGAIGPGTLIRLYKTASDSPYPSLGAVRSTGRQ